MVREKAQNIPEATKKNRRTLILIIAVSILPIALALVLHLVGWRPSSFGNYGDLVDPAKHIQDVELKFFDGKPTRFSSFYQKWSIVYFGLPECSDACIGNIFKIRSVHISQGKHQDRVQRILFLGSGAYNSELKAIHKKDSKLRVIVGPQRSIDNLIEQFTLPIETRDPELTRIYLVDPLGNFMMSYPGDTDPSHIQKDLARLLKVSHIG